MTSPTEEIKSRIDIADFIGSYVRLQRAGSTLKACCPFHNEKTPSFVVSPARQMWHCFGCGKGGDVFSFLMEIEGHDFPEALKILADRTGVVLSHEDQKSRGEKARLFEIMEAATAFFQERLKKDERVEDYLKSRKLSDDTIKEFRVGYAPNDWQELMKALGKEGFSGPELVKVGLAVAHEPTGQAQTAEVRYYDRFRGRVMFPIFDYQGRIIAFGGRLFEPPGSAPRDKEAKYINTPETPLYQKSKVLYGMHKAKTVISREGACIIVEGYMDALMAHQAGTHNVVASSGTALTQDHIHIIKRLTTTVLAAFDMDIAGQAAAERGIELLLKEGIDVKVIKLEGIKDPADAVQKDPDIWRRAVATARPLMRFYMDLAISRSDPSTPEGKREFEKIVLPKIAILSSELERAHWVAEASAVLHIPEQSIWGALSHRRGYAEGRPSVLVPQGKAVAKSRKELLEERILGMLATSPELLEKQGIVLEEPFFSKERGALFSAIRSKNSLAAFQDVIARLALGAELFLEGVPDVEAEFLHCCEELEKEYVRERMKALTFEIRRAEASSSQDLPKLLEEFQRLSLRLQKAPQNIRSESH